MTNQMAANQIAANQMAANQMATNQMTNFQHFQLSSNYPSGQNSKSNSKRTSRQNSGFHTPVSYDDDEFSNNEEDGDITNSKRQKFENQEGSKKVKLVDVKKHFTFVCTEVIDGKVGSDVYRCELAISTDENTNENAKVCDKVIQFHYFVLNNLFLLKVDF